MRQERVNQKTSPAVKPGRLLECGCVNFLELAEEFPCGLRNPGLVLTRILVVPDVAAILRAPTDREAFFNCRVIVADVRTTATVFLSLFILGLAVFGVEFQDDVTSGATHFRAAKVI